MLRYETLAHIAAIHAPNTKKIEQNGLSASAIANRRKKNNNKCASLMLVVYRYITQIRVSVYQKQISAPQKNGKGPNANILIKQKCPV